jgi:fumarate hydratase class II
MGEITVPDHALWGPQTQRSLMYFKIGEEHMPMEIIRAMSFVKIAAVRVNLKSGLIDLERAKLIEQAAWEIIQGRHDSQFPLSLWQTGSGTQSHMNVNEVISNRCNQLAGSSLIHPNDHVNRSQSSNDVFPTAMHIATLKMATESVLPALNQLAATLGRLEHENAEVKKLARTHLQDATEMTFGQEIGAWRAMLMESALMIEQSLTTLNSVALGGTAVGTGLNAPEGFAEDSVEELNKLTGLALNSSKNKFHALSSRDGLTFFHSALKVLATSLYKIAGDVRWLASGPRAGLNEIFIPENEPGSSIMPGKVNPTQCEALSMIAVQVMANDVAVSIAASQGHFQLNVNMPLILYNVLQSCRLLSDAMRSFDLNCVSGIRANEETMTRNVERSLMRITAFNAQLGYETGAKIVKLANEQNLTLEEAAEALGIHLDFSK